MSSQNKNDLCDILSRHLMEINQSGHSCLSDINEKNLMSLQTKLGDLRTCLAFVRMHLKKVNAIKLPQRAGSSAKQPIKIEDDSKDDSVIDNNNNGVTGKKRRLE